MPPSIGPPKHILLCVIVKVGTDGFSKAPGQLKTSSSASPKNARFADAQWALLECQVFEVFFGGARPTRFQRTAAKGTATRCGKSRLLRPPSLAGLLSHAKPNDAGC